MKRNTTLLALGTLVALAAHKGDAKAKAAHEQREKGAQECKAGNYAKGADHLRTAITDLGMKPVD